MKKLLIKGTLVIALIATPSAVTVEVMAYEVFKAPKPAIMMQDERSEKDAKDIDDEFEDMEENSKIIDNLLKEKKDIVNKIDASMGLKSVTKQSLSEKQIEQFQQFTQAYQLETEKLQNAMESLYNADLATAKNEILSLSSDYDKVYGELKDVSNNQRMAIDSLKSIIDISTKTLAVI